MIKDIQNQIIELKKEKNICILAHSYQSREIIEVADFTGDSFQLSLQAAKTHADNIIMCGVRFMAETVKILSPEKKVYLANDAAGCPMAEQLTRNDIIELKKKYPGYAVVAYVNTTADIKTVCDVCVTSSSAVKIVGGLPNDNIIFIPDINLGAYVKSQLPDKNIVLVDGGCPIHGDIKAEEAVETKKKYPDALLLVHPECTPEVQAIADFIGSTSAIVDFAKNSEKRQFIIGTEISIVENLKHECRDNPEKMFYPMSKNLICPDMKITSIVDVLNCMQNKTGEIILDRETLINSKKCIDEMIRLG